MRSKSINFLTFFLLTLNLFFCQIPSFGQTESRAELIVQTGHSNGVKALALSPNGKLLASASFDKTVKLWDAAKGTELRTFTGHSEVVMSISFSPDGKTLASGSFDKTIKLWNIESGREIITLTGHSGSVHSVLFSPDGKTLISSGGMYDDTIKLWNIETGSELQTFRGHSNGVKSMAFSPDKTMLAIGSDDRTIELWNLKNGAELKTLRGHPSAVQTVAFSPDGKYLASGSGIVSSDGENTLKIWDVESGNELKTLDGHSTFVLSVTFSLDGKMLASAGGEGDNTVKLWDVESGKELETFEGHSAGVSSVLFSNDGKNLISGSDDSTIKLWNATNGKELKTFRDRSSLVKSVAFSPNGKFLASGGGQGSFGNNTVKLWNLENQKAFRTLRGHTGTIELVKFSPDGKTLASAGWDKKIKVWDVESGRELATFKGHSTLILTLTFSPDSKTIVSADTSEDNSVKIWNAETGVELYTIEGHFSFIPLVKFSPDGKTIAGNIGASVKLWDAANGKEIKTFRGHDSAISSIAFSSDGKTLASGGDTSDGRINLWDLKSGTFLRSFNEYLGAIEAIDFSSDGKTIISGSYDKTIRIWDIANGTKLRSLNRDDYAVKQEIANLFPRFYEEYYEEAVSEKFVAKIVESSKVKISDIKTGKEAATLITVDENDWIVTTPEGRFDTNKSLDNIEGLHWIVNNEILKPLPLDVFIRQYYEPGLLQRILNCSENNSCAAEFRPLPSIAEINRVQPKVAVKEIKSSADSVNSVDVIIEIENVSENVSVSAADRNKKEKKSSGAYDLRLFRDGQLVGVSAPREKLAAYFAQAAELVEKGKRQAALINTPEDVEWRKANNIFAVEADNVKKISPEKIEYTFRNVKLPANGRENVEFTAYAFNADRVKSDNVSVKYQFAAKPAKKGRAVVVSIGVNASENSDYKLRYAANDAAKMQEIISGKLDASNYSEIIKIPLISDYDKSGNLAENNAQKAIIKGVFSMLAGNEKEISPDILKQITERGKIKQIEPEDTLIITYAGHGYADQSGIFYLLPYDVGTKNVSYETLPKLISSDELSLWMQNITASEMIFIIDACHSSAAVQGDGFKPGPMGSRGLGQLAYDKDMKILSATQANNVALELGSLEQGLLSYALLQDGIIKSLADNDGDKKLFSDEWLSFAEKRVPELYTEIKDGKRGVFVDGEKLKAGETRSGIMFQNTNQKSNLNLQQPTLFDFRRRNKREILFALQ